MSAVRLLVTSRLMIRLSPEKSLLLTTVASSAQVITLMRIGLAQTRTFSGDPSTRRHTFGQINSAVVVMELNRANKLLLISASLAIAPTMLLAKSVVIAHFQSVGDHRQPLSVWTRERGLM